MWQGRSPASNASLHPSARAFPAASGRPTGPTDKASPRRFVFTNVTIHIKTAAGESAHFYESVEAEADPGRDSVRLKLSGTDESATIAFTKGAVKRYELQAENFSPALLAPISASPLLLDNFIINGNVATTTSDDSTFAIEGSGSIVTRGLRCPVVSSGAIDGLTIPFDLKGNLTGSGIENVVGKISLGGETVIVRGDMRGWEKPVIDVAATFLDFSYDRAISALPPSLHPNLPVIRLAGSMTGMFRMQHIRGSLIDNLKAGQGGARRQHHFHAAGEEPVPVAGTDPKPEAGGSSDHYRPRTEPRQAADNGDLPEHYRMGGRDLRHRTRSAILFRQKPRTTVGG